MKTPFSLTAGRSRALVLVVVFPAAALLNACGGGDSGSTADPVVQLAADEVGLSRLELLGKRLFFDTSLSQPKGQACGTCHDPALAFAGNVGSTLGVAPGAVSGRFGTRNVPTAMYASFIPPFELKEVDGEIIPVGGLFWDGRAASLEAQAKMPFFNPDEMALASETVLRERVAVAPYAPLMIEIFGLSAFASDDATLDAVALALAAFQRTARFAPFNSKFDAFRRGTAQLSDLERAGLEAFKDENRGNCAACHTMDETSLVDADSLFTDFTYDNIGVPRNRRIPAHANATVVDTGLCGPNRADVAPARPDLCGAFKVPTLRNVATRPAFLHNGVFGSLRDVVDFYATRETDPFRWYVGRKYDDTPEDFVGNINTSEVPYDATPTTGPRLTDAEIDAIVAFLKTLTDLPR